RLRLDIGQIEIENHWLLAAAHDHARQRQVVARIDLLMRNEWRHVNEIARTRLRYEFEPLAPSHPSSPAHDVYYGLERAMMVRAGLGFGVDYDSSCPELFRAGARVGDRGGPVHAGRLWRVWVELGRPHDANAVETPFRLAGVLHLCIRDEGHTTYNCRMNSTRLCFSSGVSLSSRIRLKNSTVSSSVNSRPSWR